MQIVVNLATRVVQYSGEGFTFTPYLVCATFMDSNATEDTHEIVDGVTLPEPWADGAYTYNDGVFTPISADTLQAQKDAKWEKIKEERDRRVLEGGYPANGHWYYSDLIARSQHLGNARKADRIERVGGDMSAVLTNVLGSPIVVKTRDNGYTPITATAAHAIMDGAELQEMLTYGAAIAHKTAMEASVDPSAYDFSAGWPAIFGE